MPVKQDREVWPAEREGYTQQTAVAYAPIRCNSVQQSGSGLRKVVKISSLVAGLGIIWTVYDAIYHTAEIARLGLMPPGPVEVCGAAVLVWIIAKWRLSMQQLR